MKTAMSACHEHDDVLYQHYLDRVYDDIHHHFYFNKVNKEMVSETNGELFYASVNKLLAYMRLTEQDIFVDLGAGVGKMMLQIYLQTAAQEVYGIEFQIHLHQQAILAGQRVQQDLSQFGLKRKLVFLLGDFFEVNCKQATVIFINSVCFGQDMLLRLGQMINGFHAVRMVVALRPMPNLAAKLTSILFIIIRQNNDKQSISFIRLDKDNLTLNPKNLLKE